MQPAYLLTDPKLWKKYRKEKQDAHAKNHAMSGPTHVVRRQGRQECALLRPVAGGLQKP